MPTTTAASTSARTRDGPLYAPSPASTRRLRPHRARAHRERVLSGARPTSCSSAGSSDLLTGRQPRAARVELDHRPEAQQAAYDGARAGKRGAVVALDPRTGAILAMVSTPSYDPNRLAAHDPAAVQQAYDTRLHDDPTQPLLEPGDRRQIYPPGSTFKLVTAGRRAASGQYTPDTQIARARPARPAADHHDAPATTTASLRRATRSRLTDALRVSCNTAFATLGLDARRRRAARRRPRRSASASRFDDPADGRRRARFPRQRDPAADSR